MILVNILTDIHMQIVSRNNRAQVIKFWLIPLFCLSFLAIGAV